MAPPPARPAPGRWRAAHRVELELARQLAHALRRSGAARAARPRSRRAGSRCRGSSPAAPPRPVRAAAPRGGSATAARRRGRRRAGAGAGDATRSPSRRSSQSSSSLWRTGLTMKSSARDAGVVLQALVECVGRHDGHLAPRSGPRRAARRIVSQPSMPGMARSMRIASGASPAAQQVQRIVAAGGACAARSPAARSRLHQQLAVGLLVVHHQDAAARRLRSRARAARGSARSRHARRCSSGRNSRMRKQRARARRALHRHLAAHQVGQHLGDGQAQARAAGAPRGRPPTPRANGSKIARQLVRRHAGPGVLDLEARHLARMAHAERHLALRA